MIRSGVCTTKWIGDRNKWLRKRSQDPRSNQIFTQKTLGYDLAGLQTSDFFRIVCQLVDAFIWLSYMEYEVFRRKRSADQVRSSCYMTMQSHTQHTTSPKLPSWTLGRRFCYTRYSFTFSVHWAISSVDLPSTRIRNWKHGSKTSSRRHPWNPLLGIQRFMKRWWGQMQWWKIYNTTTYYRKIKKVIFSIR